jgi:protein-S-isoprenylcysteine O-methyltransferase Ste14
MAWISFFIILVATSIYCAVHSWHASNQTKGWTARNWPKFHHHFYRLFFNFIAVVSFVPVIFLTWKLESMALYTIRNPWVYLTILIQLTASIAIVLVVGDTGGSSFIGLSQLMNGPEKRRGLVTSGLYRYVRHPLYTLGLIILWLIPVMNTNILALNIGLTIYVYIGAKLEEAKLKLEYPEYAEYQKRIPMLFPLFK